jgi:hypothetical protein
VWPDLALAELRIAIEHDSTGRHGLEHVGEAGGDRPPEGPRPPSRRVGSHPRPHGQAGAARPARHSGECLEREGARPTCRDAAWSSRRAVC